MEPPDLHPMNTPDIPMPDDADDPAVAAQFVDNDERIACLESRLPSLERTLAQEREARGKVEEELAETQAALMTAHRFHKTASDLYQESLARESALKREVEVSQQSLHLAMLDIQDYKHELDEVHGRITELQDKWNEDYKKLSASQRACEGLRLAGKRGQYINPDDLKWLTRLYDKYPEWAKTMQGRVFEATMPFGAQSRKPPNPQADE